MKTVRAKPCSMYCVCTGVRSQSYAPSPLQGIFDKPGSGSVFRRSRASSCDWQSTRAPPCCKVHEVVAYSEAWPGGVLSFFLPPWETSGRAPCALRMRSRDKRTREAGEGLRTRIRVESRDMWPALMPRNSGGSDPDHSVASPAVPSVSETWMHADHEALIFADVLYGVKPCPVLGGLGDSPRHFRSTRA